MPRTWRRSTIARQCGGCGETIPKDAPLLALQPAGLGRELIRCAACADEPVPEAFVPPVMPVFDRVTLRPWPGRLRTLPAKASAPLNFDWRKRAAEPGDVA